MKLDQQNNNEVQESANSKINIETTSMKLIANETFNIFSNSSNINHQSSNEEKIINSSSDEEEVERCDRKDNSSSDEEVVKKRDREDSISSDGEVVKKNDREDSSASSSDDDSDQNSPVAKRLRTETNEKETMDLSTPNYYDTKKDDEYNDKVVSNCIDDNGSDQEANAERMRSAKVCITCLI